MIFEQSEELEDNYPLGWHTQKKPSPNQQYSKEMNQIPLRNEKKNRIPLSKQVPPVTCVV